MQPDFNVARLIAYCISWLQVVCRDPARKRDFQLEPSTKVSADVGAIINDPSIDMVVEVAGGMDAARELMLHSAKAGRSVVTANKALLAAHLPEIEAAFPASGKARLGYEAAVAGGIPIIRTMQQGLLLDNVTSVAGILNGTTNFMLSAMAERGASYAAILKEAQEKGFAEADPTADVEGHDARNKLVLLAKLAYGVTIPVSGVRTVGISGVTPDDVSLARALGYAIKLIGRAAVSDGAVEASVTPALVPTSDLMGGTGGALNIVKVDSEFLGTSYYRGAGAGRFPTANSVVADMINIALGTQSASPFPLPTPSGSGGGGLALSDDVTCEVFVRADNTPMGQMLLKEIAAGSGSGGTVAAPITAGTSTGAIFGRQSLKSLLTRLEALHAREPSVKVYPVFR